MILFIGLFISPSFFFSIGVSSPLSFHRLFFSTLVPPILSLLPAAQFCIVFSLMGLWKDHPQKESFPPLMLQSSRLLSLLPPTAPTSVVRIQLQSLRIENLQFVHSELTFRLRLAGLRYFAAEWILSSAVLWISVLFLIQCSAASCGEPVWVSLVSFSIHRQSRC